VRVSLKAVPGVDSVNVSLEKGLASVTLKPGNTTTLKQLQDAIAKNGFTMKDANAEVAGKVVEEGGRAKFQITGSNDVLDLSAESAASPPPRSLFGKSVVASGVIPEPPKGKAPTELRYRSIVEQK
jgi:copper chaperone CopZ